MGIDDAEHGDRAAVRLEPLSDAEVGALLRDLGTRAASLRRAAGYTQVELAERSAVHFITISRLERGSQTVSVAVLWKLAHAMGKNVSDFLL